MEFVSTAELARRLKIHRVTAARFVREGRIPARRVGRTWVIDVRDLEAFVATYRKEAGSQGRHHAPSKPLQNPSEGPKAGKERRRSDG